MMSSFKFVFLLSECLILLGLGNAFQNILHRSSLSHGLNSCRVPSGTTQFATTNDKSEGSTTAESVGVEEYKNVATKVLSKFMQKDAMPDSDPLSEIDFAAEKIPPTTSLETLAAALDYELIESEWFVTGKVNPSYFSDDFEFQDPDVKLSGIEDYARGVYKLFDQSTSRAEIISTVVNSTASTPERPVITCTWRLSGNVNIAFGLPIKPYIVCTDFVVDPSSSLIISQEDRFEIPGWDILVR
jgi:hypothetical protein